MHRSARGLGSVRNPKIRAYGHKSRSVLFTICNGFVIFKQIDNLTRNIRVFLYPTNHPERAGPGL